MHEQAAATGWKQCKLPLSHSGSTQIQSGGDAATRSQHLLSRRSDATRIQPTRDCAYDDINLHTTQTEAITALRVSTTAQCTMPRASSRNWLETMQAPVSTRNDYSNPVRRRCSDSQPTSTQSQVGCNPYSAVQMRHARLRVRRHQSAHEPDLSNHCTARLNHCTMHDAKSEPSQLARNNASSRINAQRSTQNRSDGDAVTRS